MGFLEAIVSEWNDQLVISVDLIYCAPYDNCLWKLMLACQLSHISKIYHRLIAEEMNMT